jgi:GTP-binding protein HflX
MNRDVEREKAVLIGVETAGMNRWRVEDHLDELKQLADTAGAEVTHILVQKIPRPSPAYYIGSGKVEELKKICDREAIDLVVFDEELSAAQVKNLQDATGCRVIDRTELIMDIFAQHATSREGKLQVELAQLRYMLPRLTRAWTHLSRQEGGIGTRGPGEKQLEVDRRRIRERIKRLTNRLELIGEERETQRKQRRRKGIPVVSLVGYTNAGKSTLMNALTHAGVLVEDKLFATLDPTTRVLSLPRGGKILLTDTVGFIRKLPHHLVESFKATLEGVVTADVLVHVIDISHDQVEEQMNGVWLVLKELKSTGKPIIAAFNKIDLLKDGARLRRYEKRVPESVEISASSGIGLTRLLEKIESEVSKHMVHCRLRIPQSEAALISRLYTMGNIISRCYEDNSVVLVAELPLKLAREVRPYTKEDRAT